MSGFTISLSARKAGRLYLKNSLQQKGCFNFKRFYKNKPTWFHSYGRLALVSGLKAAGVSRGDKVCLPALIGREILASLHEVGCSPVFYDVNHSLQADFSPEQLPKAKAMIAVNYFGIPQNLDRYYDYCRLNDAVLVEDNAHGFLSRTPEGEPLGTRGDLGIISIRKTLPLFNGAALLVNNPEKMQHPLPGESRYSGKVPLSFKTRFMLRLPAHTFGRAHLLRLSRFAKRIRNISPGSAHDSPGYQPETTLPVPPHPFEGLNAQISRVSYERERERRQTLYQLGIRILSGSPALIPWPRIHPLTVPMGLAFFASDQVFAGLRETLRACGLEAYTWPELPSKIRQNCRPYYRTLRVVRFQW